MQTFQLKDFFPYKLAVLSSRISKNLAEIYGREYKISQAEWRVLAHLTQQEKISVREIHQQIDMDKSKVSRAATRLEAAGFIRKQINANDKRLVSLSLTRKGHTMMDKLAVIAREYEQDVLSKLTDEQRATMDEIFEVLL